MAKNPGQHQFKLPQEFIEALADASVSGRFSLVLVLNDSIIKKIVAGQPELLKVKNGHVIVLIPTTYLEAQLIPRRGNGRPSSAKPKGGKH